MQTSRLALALLVACGGPTFAAAQLVGRVGEDARVAPRGSIGVTIGGAWSRWYERFGGIAASASRGTLEPLGLDFSVDSLGPKQLENLTLTQASVRALAATSDFVASLGQWRLKLRNQVVVTPVGLTLGLWGGTEFSVTAPFVTTRAEADLRVNPTGSLATVAFNPARTAAAAVSANALLLSQFDSAAAQLNRRLTLCAASPASTGCAAFNASAASVRALIQDANAFASGLAELYGGRAGGRGGLFVPISGSRAQLAIDARVAAFRTAFAGYGSTAVSVAGPFAAQTAMTIADANALLSDDAFGLKARPLATVVNRGLGDVEAALKLKLFDTFGADTLAPGLHVRQAVGVLYRLGTGTLDAPDNFLDVGTGQHQNDIEAHSYTDIGIGRRFTLSLVARYNMQQADQRAIRITAAPELPMAAAYRTQTVQRDLGDEIEVALAPRWRLNPSLSLWGYYGYRHKAADAYSGSFRVTNLAGAAITLNAATLDAETEESEHRFGAGATYSTVASWARGAAPLPVEVSFSHFQTTGGSGGAAPKLAVDQVRVTVYRRLFGR